MNNPVCGSLPPVQSCGCWIEGILHDLAHLELKCYIILNQDCMDHHLNPCLCHVWYIRPFYVMSETFCMQILASSCHIVFDFPFFYTSHMLVALNAINWEESFSYFTGMM